MNPSNQNLNTRTRKPKRKPTKPHINPLLPLQTQQTHQTAYGASKHAAESWSNSLRAELRHFGVEVCTVNPVWHRTEIAASQLPHLLGLYDALPPQVQADYGREYFQTVGEASFQGKQSHVWRVRGMVGGEVVVTDMGVLQDGLTSDPHSVMRGYIDFNLSLDTTMYRHPTPPPYALPPTYWAG